ncbi:hypothetical protein ABK040_002417 [Willaertia magna]
MMISQHQTSSEVVGIDNKHSEQQEDVEDGKWSKLDEEFMKEALKMAEKALMEGEVPVGCVIVYNGKIIGRGSNKTNETKNGTRHAEFVAIDEIYETMDNQLIQEDFFFSKCELYVTVEPCIMCAGALSLLQFGKIIFGCKNERFGGCGSVLNIHQHQFSNQHSSLLCVHGLFEKEAIEILQKFYEQENPLAPNPKPKKKKVKLQELQ